MDRPKRPDAVSAVAGAIGGLTCAVLLLQALATPVTGWDGLMTWLPQSRLMREERTATPAAFRDPWVWVSHPQYPPLVSLVQVTGLEVVSAPVDERAGRAVFPLFFAAFLALLHRTVRVLTRNVRAAALTVVLAAMTPFLAFSDHGGARGAYADVPLAAFLGGALAVLLCGGLRSGAGLAGGLLLAGAVLTKNEGTPLASGVSVLLLLVAIAGSWARPRSVRWARAFRALRNAVAAAVLLGASIALLHAWRAEIPNRYDESYAALLAGTHLEAAQVVGKLATVTPALATGLVDVKKWGLLWPLLVALALVRPGGLRRRAALAAGGFFLGPVAIALAAYAVHVDPVYLADVTWDRFLVQGAFGTFLLLGLVAAGALPARGPGPEPTESESPCRKSDPAPESTVGRLPSTASPPDAMAGDRVLRAVPRLEDLFVFAFATAIVREALWLMPGSALPIALSAAAGLAAVAVVRRSAHERPSPPWLFWLVVALPILVLWALRVPLPDIGYDTLNYHVMHGERGLWGPLFPPGDFYPYFFPFLNPAADLVTAMFRAVLGYRGGTVGSVLALIWSGQILWRLLTPSIRDERARAVAVLLAVTTEGMLWEVSGYMVDLLSLPVLLEATRLAIAEVRPERPLHRRTAALGVLLGTAVALKLTNLVFVLPIGLVALVRWLDPRTERLRAAAVLGASAAGALAFAFPIAPHMLLLLAKTGSPVFPYFNKLFASPFYPPLNIKDLRWGPSSVTEALRWPLLSALRPERLSEFAVTTGRLALGWGVALAALVVFWKDARLRAISVIVVVGGLLWSFGTGYHRYGLFVELLGGLLMALVAAKLAERASGGESGPASRSGVAPRVAAVVLFLLAASQSAWGILLVLRSDWGGRPTVFYSPGASARDALFLLRDRDLRAFLSPEERKAIPENPVWIDVGPKSNGIMSLLDRDAPMIGLQVEGLLAVPLNLQRLDAALAASRGRTGCAIAFEPDAEAVESTLAWLGFPATRRTHLDLPFFSKERLVGVVVFEVALPPPLGVPPVEGVQTPWAVDALLFGSMDGPVPGQEVQGDLLVRGWAREPGEDLLVKIFVGGVEVAPSSFRRVPRPDVAAALPQMGDCSSAGYEAVVPRPAGAPGEVEVSVDFRSRSGRMRHYPGVKIRWEAPAKEGTPLP